MRLCCWNKSFGLARRALAYPIRKRRDRVRWLTEASNPGSNVILGLSDGAKRVYFRYGTWHSTSARLQKQPAFQSSKRSKLIPELERRGLPTHRRRNKRCRCGFMIFRLWFSNSLNFRRKGEAGRSSCVIRMEIFHKEATVSGRRSQQEIKPNSSVPRQPDNGFIDGGGAKT
jgi:hypothetical protein